MTEYMQLPHEERTLMRRAAFGMAGIPSELTAGYNLAALRDLLLAENERTGQFAGRWTDLAEDDETLENFR